MHTSPTHDYGNGHVRMTLQRYRPGRFLQLAALLVVCYGASAASFEFLDVEDVFDKSARPDTIEPYTIVIASGQRRFEALPSAGKLLLPEFLLYQTRVKVDDQITYRLALGNFSSMESARETLRRLRNNFADAWIYRRSPEEKTQLALFLERSGATTIGGGNATAAADAARLLEQARQEFIDGNYARVIAITDRITITGNITEVRKALELAGITRERQGKYPQAIVLYEALLETEPEAETRSRVEGRLQSIRTMSQAPKPRIETNTASSERSPWSSRGIFQQFYQDDLVDSSAESFNSVNRLLVTDMDLFVQRRTDRDKLEFRIDAGLVRDFLDDSTESRLSSASLEYAREDFRVVGGRQRRTLTGIYRSFDGISIADLSHSSYQLGFAYGYLVQSSFDGFNSDQPFYGINLNLTPSRWLDMSFYVIHQEISDLTDREALGSEISYQSDNAFAYGMVDYDIFFDRLNNVTLISNYQFRTNWSLDLSVTEGYSPTFSTVNALQGQSVRSIEELKLLFSDDKIYQIAEDRSAKILDLFIGASYRFDTNRFLHFDFSSLTVEATGEPGDIARIPSSEYLQVSIDYSFQGFLFERDYATVGGRASDSTTSETLSIRARTRFSNGQKLSYDPRLQLDRRKSKIDGVQQLILKPSFKITYRSTNRLSFEAIFGIEYSDLNLPELEDRYIYSYYLGYYYYMF